MEKLTLIFIIIPFFSILVDFLLKRFNKISQIALITLQAVSLSIVSYILYTSFNSAHFNKFMFTAKWIAFWDINFIFNINGANIISIFSVSLIFFIIFIQNLFYKSNFENRFNYLLIQGSIIATILSYNLIVKLFFWELSWLPVVLLLSYKQKESFRYSKMWFFSQFFIISALVMLSINNNFTFNIFELYNKSLDLNSNNILSFTFISIGLGIRLSIFPFDKWVYSIFKNTNYISSAMIIVIIPLTSYHFLTEFYKVIYSEYISYYSLLLTYSFFLLSVPPLIKLFLNKRIDHLLAYIIIMLNPFIFIWVVNSENIHMQAIFELIYTKFFISISLIYFGKILIDYAKTNKLNTILHSNKFLVISFFTSIFLSFGIPGLTLINPFFYLFSYLAKFNLFISLSIFFTILLSFVYIIKNLIYILDASSQKAAHFKQPILNYFCAFLFIIISVSIASYPTVVHKMINVYYSEVNIK